MKLKTKLVSILGTAAIATTSLSVVSACTFTRKPKGEYDKPTFHYAGETTLATEEGRNTLAISGFYANRDLYTGEEVTIEAINPTSNDKSEDVTASFSKDENGFVVNVTLTKIEAESTEEGGATFNLLFKTKYDNQTYEIPLENKTFTVNYIPKYVRNDITLFGATTVSTPKGNSEFTLQYQLNHKLEANRTILTPETNNSKVHYRSMSREGQIITLTL
ncbi:MAG: hypothetical protein MJ201_04360 [Mycoplasmoidaceae bacterium]|nr:hypothetical protein [Mycoplasmoidaceae bacterium]